MRPAAKETAMPYTESEFPSGAETTPAPPSECCGGPAPVRAGACCVQDADAKAAGRAGCGCAASVSQVDPQRGDPLKRRLQSAVIVATCLSLTVLAAATQDPLVVSPDAYRLEFENSWVKVVRVIYGPKAVIAPHFHTERASAYVYLNDGGPILFKHEGLPYAGVTRPATKAGSFRVYKGIREVHSVENPTATPSEFLRVELKTEPLDEGSLKGKFFREDPGPTATRARTQFENAQVRVTRVSVAAGDTVALRAAGGHPALLVALSPTAIVEAGGQARHIDSGRTAWIDADGEARLRANSTVGEVLRFDLKSRPMETR
jgi:quercetin dioxygenase-like cupin family protein